MHVEVSQFLPERQAALVFLDAFPVGGVGGCNEAIRQG